MRVWIDDERPIPDGFMPSAPGTREPIPLRDRAREAGNTIELVPFDHDRREGVDSSFTPDGQRPLVI